MFCYTAFFGGGQALVCGFTGFTSTFTTGFCASVLTGSGAGFSDSEDDDSLSEEDEEE